MTDFFGPNLKFLRTKQKLSQQALAEKIGANRGNIDSYERTGTHPKQELANNICKVFNISLDELYNKDLSKVIEDRVSEKDVKYGATSKHMNEKELLFQLLESKNEQIRLHNELEGLYKKLVACYEATEKFKVK